MRFARWGGLAVAVVMVVAIVGGFLAPARWTLQAQDRAVRGQVKAKGEPAARGAGLSVQDALLRPLDLPFEAETTLEEVRQFLGKALGAQVVLDRGALDRLELTPEDTVQLGLKGVRLKVGLKLVLDQVGMTYRVIPEDNLLILTDPLGSDDPGERTLAEIKALHLEMHDLQDAVDDLGDLVEEELGIEPERPRRQSTLVRAARSRASQRGSRSLAPARPRSRVAR